MDGFDVLRPPRQPISFDYAAGCRGEDIQDIDSIILFCCPSPSVPPVQHQSWMETRGAAAAASCSGSSSHHPRAG